MVAYFCSLLLLGIPLCWIEWSLGRKAGKLGTHSVAAAYQIISGSRLWKYIGLICVLTPLTLAMYYLYIEGWTLGYTYHMVAGDLDLAHSEQFGQFFERFIGVEANGKAFDLQHSKVLIFFGIAIILNATLIYRGVSKGIEWFCKWSMPVLLGLAVIIMIRVLTLGTPDANLPNRNINEGLGYMWNPSKSIVLVDGKASDMLPAQASSAQQAEALEQIRQEYPQQEVTVESISFIQGLLNPELWLAAAGQIFFSLSVGFGTIMTYASYVKHNSDIALSSLTANAANEVVEVGIAGMMIIPAAVSFLGVAAAAGVSTFGLGFNVLPQVFAAMPLGNVFGALFFGLLFLAAVTSSISLMQPCVAFLEEFWGVSRKISSGITTAILAIGALIVAWFTGDGLIALDTLDFFYGTLGLYISCTLMLFIFNVAWKTDEGIKELQHSSLIKIPTFVGFIMKWVTPCILLVIFTAWLSKNIFIETGPQVQRVLELHAGAIIPLLWTGLVFIFFVIVTYTSKKHHKHSHLDKQ